MNAQSESKTIANLGEIVGKLLQVEEGTRSQWDDLRLFGAPSELGLYITRETANKFEAIAAQYGTTLREIKIQVEQRTTSKWVYRRYGVVLLPEI